MKLARALAAALLLAGCSIPANDPPQTVSRDANGIAYRVGAAINTDNMAALHCQYYGKLMVPNGTEMVGNQHVVRYYRCQ